jgi:hypothetical protein
MFKKKKQRVTIYNYRPPVIEQKDPAELSEEEKCDENPAGGEATSPKK